MPECGCDAGATENATKKERVKTSQVLKGPFRTKNSTAPESVVFCYRRCFFTIRTVFLPLFPRKNKHFSALSVAFCDFHTDFSRHSEFAVLFLVRKGPWVTKSLLIIWQWEDTSAILMLSLAGT